MGDLTIDPIVGWVLRVSLALLFTFSAWHKLRDLAGFRETLRDYRLLPDLLVSSTAGIVVAIEALTSLALCTPAAASMGAAMAASMLVVYSTAIAVNLVRGRRSIDCGCLGPASDQSISPALLSRNAILVAGALAAMLPAGHRSLHWVDSLTFIAGLGCLFMLFIAANQLLAIATRHSQLGSPS
jgi:uncharacterized membrane protein YphA (DoxX/SURF4 family)